MNKSELVDAIASTAELSKAAASRALQAMTENITGALEQGSRVTLVGFGTFSVKDRPERNGRNPQTGAPMKIKATRVPVFKAGEALKVAVGNKNKKKGKK